VSDMQKQCAACGSERIIPLATVTNDAQGLGRAYQGEPMIVINTNPHAGIFAQRYVLSRIHAWVCGECGYMQLFADDPQMLHAAYQEFLRATQG
jgi:ribosomal protein S27AE